MNLVTLRDIQYPLFYVPDPCIGIQIFARILTFTNLNVKHIALSLCSSELLQSASVRFVKVYNFSPFSDIILFLLAQRVQHGKKFPSFRSKFITICPQISHSKVNLVLIPRKHVSLYPPIFYPVYKSIFPHMFPYFWYKYINLSSTRLPSFPASLHFKFLINLCSALHYRPKLRFIITYSSRKSSRIPRASCYHRPSTEMKLSRHH